MQKRGVQHEGRPGRAEGHLPGSAAASGRAGMELRGGYEADRPSLGPGLALPLGSRRLPHQSGLELLRGPGGVRGCSKALQAGRPQAGQPPGSGRSVWRGRGSRGGTKQRAQPGTPASRCNPSGLWASLAQMGGALGQPGTRASRGPARFTAAEVTSSPLSSACNTSASSIAQVGKSFVY